MNNNETIGSAYWLAKIRKMVFLTKPTEGNSGEEVISGENRLDLLIKYEGILKRVFKTDLEEIEQWLQKGTSIDIYFFAGEKRGEERVNRNTKQNINRIKVGYFLHKLHILREDKGEEILLFKEVPGKDQN